MRHLITATIGTLLFTLVGNTANAGMPFTLTPPSEFTDGSSLTPETDLVGYPMRCTGEKTVEFVIPVNSTDWDWPAELFDAGEYTCSATSIATDAKGGLESDNSPSVTFTIDPVDVAPKHPILRLIPSGDINTSTNVYNLRIEESGLCLGVEDESIEDGGNIVQLDCSGSAAQQFRVIDKNGGLVITTGTGSKNKTVDSSQSGLNVYQWENFGADNQKWTYFNYDSASSTGQIKNISTELCMQVADDLYSVGANINTGSCVENKPGQLIRFTPIS